MKLISNKDIDSNSKDFVILKNILFFNSKKKYFVESRSLIKSSFNQV